jgi:hypothetical protein
MISNFILILTLQSIAALFFTFFGKILLEKAINNSEIFSQRLKFSMSYFLGITIFLFLYRFLNIFINSFYSFLFSFVLIIIITIIDFKKSYFYSIINIKWKKYLIIFVSLLLIQFLFWIGSNESLNNSFSSIGSLHSIRYINIAKYIVSENEIPLLNQNYGQSLLTTIPLYFNIGGAPFSLFYWLSISTFFLFILTFGLLTWLGLSSKSAKYGSLIVMIGNTALSFTHILVIDSGSPFLFNGYSDSIISIGTFVVYIIWFIFKSKSKFKNLYLESYLFLFFLAASWNIYAPQNIIFTIIVFIFFIIKVFIKKQFSIKNLFLSFIFFVMTSLIFSFTGGMLTPKEKVKPGVNISGVMKFSRNEKVRSGIMPYLPYNYFNGKNWEINDFFLGNREKILNLKNEVAKTKKVQSISELFFQFFYIFELNLWVVIKILFFPLIGLGGSLLYNNLIRKNSEKGMVHFIFSYFMQLNFLLFISGFLITYSLILSGYKWELSRFLIPGIYTSMIIFTIIFYSLRHRLMLYNYLFNIALLMIIGPPILQSLFFIFLNLRHKNNFFEKVIYILS